MVKRTTRDIIVDAFNVKKPEPVQNKAEINVIKNGDKIEITLKFTKEVFRKFFDKGDN